MKTRIVLLPILAAALLAFAQPAYGCNPPTNVAVSNITPFSATLTWSQSDNATRGYLLEFYYLPDTIHSQTIETSSSSHSYTWTLSPGSHYRARIASICWTGSNLDTSSFVQVEFYTDSFQCSPPSNVQLLFLTDSRIALHWIVGDYESSYRVKWWAVGDSIADSTIYHVLMHPDTEIVPQYCFINGLRANTAYRIQIRTTCQAGLNSNLFDTTITTTACNSISSLPYHEDFEDDSVYLQRHFAPTCWNSFNRSNFNIAVSSRENSPAGWPNTTCLYIPYRTVVQLPPIDTSILPLSQLQIRFSVQHAQRQLRIGALDNLNDTSQFQLAGTLPLSSGQWHDFTIPLSACHGMEHVALISPSNAIYLDNVIIEPIPNCQHPQNLSIASCTATGAHLTWDVPNDSLVSGYNVRLVAADTTLPARIFNPAEPSLYITNLIPNTRYIAYISTRCNNNSNSTTDSLTFRTLNPEGICVIPQVDITEHILGQTSIIWLPGNADTLWSIFTRASTESLPHLLDSAVNTNTYTLYNLPQGVPSTIYVVPFCDGTANWSHADSVVAIALCYPIDSLPYIEDFNSHSNFSNEENCWNTLGTVYGQGSWQGGNREGYLAIFNNGSYAILPEFTQAINGLSIEFISRTYSVGSIIAGVITDIADPATFIPVDSIAVSLADESRWVPRRIRFNNYTGPTGHIAITARNTSLLIDDLSVYLTPTCREPDSVRLTSTTLTSATFQWRHNPAAFSYEIEYGPRRFTLGTGTVASTVDDSITLTGLQRFSNYDYFVRTICMSGDTSLNTFRANFSTGCGLIDSLPYIEDLDQWPAYHAHGDGSNQLPPCWAANYYCYVYNNGEEHNQYQIVTTNTNPIVAPPAIDTTRFPMRNICVTLRLHALSSYYATSLIVGTCSDPLNLSTFVPADTIALTTTPTLHQVFFDNCAIGGNYIGLVPSNGIRLDSLAIDIPSCNIPSRLTASNTTTTTAELNWVDHSSALGTEIEYGPAGFSLGTGSRVIALSHPFTLTGLRPGCDYEFYVRDICAPGDTSGWTFYPTWFQTDQVPQPVPFCDDFEDSLGRGQWRSVSTDNTYQWVSGTHLDYISGNHSLYPSNDNGATASVPTSGCMALFRDLDFGNNDTTYSLTFRTRVCSEASVNYDNLYIFLADPDQPVPPTWSTQTPWGNIRDLNVIYHLQSNINWINHTVDLDTLHGHYRIVFLWMNDGRNSRPVAFDNICVSPSECPRPFNIECVARTTATADLAWYGDTGVLYQVRYYNVAGGAARTCSTYTNSVHLEGLNSGEYYTVQVRRRCGTRWSAYAPDFSLALPYCDEEASVTLMDPTSTTTSNRLPFSSSHNVSYTQQIYPATEVGGAGYITRLDFHHTGRSDLNSLENCFFYLGHTDKQAFTNDSDFVEPYSLQMVYMGSIAPTAGWTSIDLETPFLYNGTDNLLLAVLDMSGYTLPRSSFSVDTTPDFSSIQILLRSPIYLRDTAQIDSLQGQRVRYILRNQVRIAFCQELPCDVPQTLKPNARPGRTSIRWHSCGDSSIYTAEYRHFGFPDWTSLGTTTDTFAYIRETNAGEDYFYRVRHECPGLSSRWSIGHFSVPPSACMPPENFRPYNLTHNSATLSWIGDENNGHYEIHLFNTNFGYDRTAVSYFNRYRFDSLQVGPVYHAVVRAHCTDSDSYSNWSDTLHFSLPACPDVDSVFLLGTDGTSATLDWDGAPDAEGWIVAYGNVGALMQYFDTVIARSHPYTLQDLEPGRDYEVHVRTICSGGYPSEHWSEALVFNTSVGINSPDGLPAFSLRPNPTNGTVQVVLPETASNVRIEVLDLMGRIIPVTQTYSPSFSLDLSPLPAGVYMVRVSTDSFSAIQRLIKQ